MNTINVYEQPLPGLGQRFDLELDQHHTVTVIALRDGRRQLSHHATGEDTPHALIDLDRDQATTVGALLLGAQFSIDTAAGAEHNDRVVVDTITVAHDAPAIDKTPSDALHEFGSHVVVLAVIRDQTPDIIEHDPQLALGEGDRVAVAARRSLHQAISHALTGS